ncbi:MAG: ester cyclase [Candidatus Limnocylindrales bacterium]
MGNLSHEDLVRRWVAMFNSQDFSDAGRLAAPDYVEHAVVPFGRTETGSTDGPTHLGDAAAWLIAQFPDLEMRIVAIVADDSMVGTLVTTTGTNLGPLNGVIPATGLRFVANQSHWFRVRDGRLAEHWATRDDLSAMVQLGVITPPGGPR